MVRRCQLPTPPSHHLSICFTAPKYLVGGLSGLVSESWRENVYRVLDRFGSSNAIVTQVVRKPSTQHNTPLRQSLTEPIVFDAYARSEFSFAFREDIERPGPARTFTPKIFRDIQTWLGVDHFSQTSPETRSLYDSENSFDWSR